MDLLREGLIEAVRMIVRCDARVMAPAWRSLWISGLAVCLAGGIGILLGLLLARCHFVGRSVLVLLLRTGMGMPTVLVGLCCYALLSRRGPLGGLDLLYTPWAIVAGEFLLALPIVATLTFGAIRSLDPRVAETAWTLGANGLWRCRVLVSEARLGIALAMLTAFGRCFTELGIAMMVGGNIRYRTRTLATSTALETARGEFSRGLAMGLILLAVAASVTLVAAWTTRREDGA